MMEEQKQKLPVLKIVLIVLGVIVVLNAVVLGGIFAYEKFSKKGGSDYGIIEARDLRESDYTISMIRITANTFRIEVQAKQNIIYSDIELFFYNADGKIISNYIIKDVAVSKGKTWSFDYEISYGLVPSVKNYKATINGRVS